MIVNRVFRLPFQADDVECSDDSDGFVTPPASIQQDEHLEDEIAENETDWTALVPQVHLF